jgi:taurine dioxygenase
MITATSLAAPFGAEVAGLKLDGSITDQEQRHLRSLLDEHQLLVFRGQDIDVEAQKRLVAVFGPLCDERRDGSYYAVNSNVEKDPVFVQTRLGYHQDYSWTPFPLPVISLYGTEVSGNVVATLFVSNTLGYRSLTERQRRDMDGLEVVHARHNRVGDAVSALDEIDRTRLDGSDEMADLHLYPRTVQPLFKPHPRTGEPMLYVSELFTSHALGIDADESERIIQEAYRVLYAPENTYQHDWSVGDLVVWDNIAVQHARTAVASESRRTLRRVTVSEKSLDEICAAAGMVKS